MRIANAVLLLPLLLLVACSGGTEVEEATILGTVEIPGDPLVLTVPDTVSAGVSFEVAVTTYGGGCVRMGPTEADVRGDTILVTPYDIALVGSDLNCTLELRIFRHSVALSWPRAGEMVLSVRGRVQPDDVERIYRRAVVVR